MLPKDYVRLRLTGEWAIGRRRRVRHAAARRRRPRAGRTRCSTRSSSRRRGCRPARVARVSGATIAVTRVTGSRSRPGRGLRAPRSASGSTGRGRSRSCWEPRASCSRRCRRSRPIREARVHAFCHAVPGTVARDGRDALGRGLAAVVPRPAGAGRALRRARRRGRGVGAGRRGPPLCAVPRRRAHAARRSRRAGAFTGLELRHDRGALVRAVLEGVAFGLRDSLELVQRARRPRRPCRASRRRRARRSGSQIVASVLGLPIELTAVEEGSAYGAALLGGVAGGHVRRRSRRRRPLRPGSHYG